ncbi:LysR family transcriptional regulator [Pseudomonas sp. A2]|uniref:LysR family transcriptional regulator n=1 Tax=Pseudomonas sp. A2 TaxID=107445 RepID=UPI002BFAE8B0|nr:LysR family transcriptional regulator [Pseudomonas sp. A2]MEB3438082.1 LysR family transcriptional regulator [Pseudomonas sp. A2]
MLPDLVSLALFLRTVDSGSLSKAAEQSHIALSAASRRIGLLESDLDVKLLDRGQRGVTPTPAGLALAAHARRLLSEAERLKTNLSDYARGVKGIVRLYANTSALTQYLPGEIATFSTSFPNIRVEVTERLSSDIIQAISEGLADIGVVFTSEIQHSGLRLLPYKVDHLVAVLPQDAALGLRRLSLSDLLDSDLVVLESNTAMLKLLEGAAEAQGKKLRLRVQVKSFEAICKMIEAGLGIGILPKIAAEAFAQELNLRLVPLADTWAIRQMYVCCRDEELPVSVQKMLDHLLADMG